MAKILNGVKTNSTMDYISDVVDKRMETDYKSYSRFLDRAPIPVTYYKQNIVESTTDSGMGNVYGNNSASTSAKRYNRIDKLPIYNVDLSKFDLDVENGRIKGESTTKATIIPHTIEPIPEDYLVIMHKGISLVFKVTSIDIDNIKSDNFFEIGLKYNGTEFKHLEEDTVERFTCVYENIGSEDKALIQNDLLPKMELMKSIYNTLVDDYMDLFFDQRADSFIFDVAYRHKLYDPYLTKFISDNRLFEREYSSKSYHIVEKIYTTRDFNKKYKESIYHHIELNKRLEYYEKHFRDLRITDVSTYFGSTAMHYCQIDLYDGIDAPYLYPHPYTRFILNKDDKIVCDTPIDLMKDNEAEVFYDVLRLYFNNESTGTIIDFIDEHLDDMLMEHSFSHFIYVPMVLYVINHIITNISSSV